MLLPFRKVFHQRLRWVNHKISTHVSIKGLPLCECRRHRGGHRRCRSPACHCHAVAPAALHLRRSRMQQQRSCQRTMLRGSRRNRAHLLSKPLQAQTTPTAAVKKLCRQRSPQHQKLLSAKSHRQTTSRARQVMAWRRARSSASDDLIVGFAVLELCGPELAPTTAVFSGHSIQSASTPYVTFRNESLPGSDVV